MSSETRSECARGCLTGGPCRQRTRTRRGQPRAAASSLAPPASRPALSPVACRLSLTSIAVLLAQVRELQQMPSYEPPGASELSEIAALEAERLNTIYQE